MPKPVIPYKEIFSKLLDMAMPQTTPIPIDSEDSDFILRYDGKILHFHQKTAKYHMPLRTRISYQHGSSLSGGHLMVKAKVKIGQDVHCFQLFLEPRKGDYDNFQGFHYHDCESRSGGTETSTTITIDVTEWHEYGIVHYYDQSQCDFYVDGSLVASHTTNISAQPFEFECGEVDGVAGVDVYVEFPPGIQVLYRADRM